MLYKYQWLVQTIQDGVSVFHSTRDTPTHTHGKSVFGRHTHTPWEGITPVVCNRVGVYIHYRGRVRGTGQVQIDCHGININSAYVHCRYMCVCVHFVTAQCVCVCVVRVSTP